MVPINKELKPKIQKSAPISTGVDASIFEFLEVYLRTVLNKIIDTASLRIPSPNIILNNLGYLS